MKANLLFGLLLIFGSAAPLCAVNTYVIPWDGTIATHYDLGDTTTRQFLASAVDGGMALPTLTADFLADKDFQINFSTIAGQTVQVTPPDTASDVASLIFMLNSAITLQGLFVDGSFNGATFTGLTGTAPTVGFSQFQHASSSFFGGTNPQFGTFVRLDSTAPYSFTGVTLNFTAPAGMDMIYTNHAMQGAVFYEMTDATSDPGQWVTLSAVPEPSRTMFWMTGLAVLVLRRTRGR